MRSDQYLQQVTSHITEPAAANEVYRELKAHLEEAAAELTAKGIEPETAEAVAVERMGPADGLGRSLGAIHHRHLPWRHYLAIPALIPFVGAMLLGNGDTASFWFVAILVCLFPGIRFWQQVGRTIATDGRAKLQWVLSQPLLQAAKAGGIVGAAAGVVFIIQIEGFYRVVWFFLRQGVRPWTVLLTVALLALIPARRFYRGPILPVLVFAGVTFLVVIAPFVGAPWQLGSSRWAGEWLVIGGTFTIALLMAGAVVHWLERLWLRVRVLSTR